MAASLNKVILIGNLGKDPESKSFSNGGKVVNFSVATSESWKDRGSGEKKEKTTWHNVAIFNENLADIATKYMRKGSKVYLEGKIQTRKYQDQSGNDRYVTEVVLQGFDCKLMNLDSRQQQDADTQYPEEYRGGSGSSPGGAGSSRNAGADVFGPDDDDDVPF